MKALPKPTYDNLFLCIGIFNSLFMFRLLQSTAEEITLTFIITGFEYCSKLVIILIFQKIFKQRGNSIDSQKNYIQKSIQP